MLDDMICAGPSGLPPHLDGPNKKIGSSEADAGVVLPEVLIPGGAQQLKLSSRDVVDLLLLGTRPYRGWCGKGHKVSRWNGRQRTVVWSKDHRTESLQLFVIFQPSTPQSNFFPR